MISSQLLEVTKSFIENSTDEQGNENLIKAEEKIESIQKELDHDYKKIMDYAREKLKDVVFDYHLKLKEGDAEDHIMKKAADNLNKTLYF